MWKRFAEGLLDLLAPPSCAACAAPLLARALGFCDGCRPLLEPAPSAPSDRHRDALIYGGPVREALHRFKYEGASELAGPLAALLVDSASALLGRVDVVTAVPLHRRRLRERGYNQALLLAGPLARTLGVRFDPALLARTRDTQAQVGRARAQRTAQLAGAFVARPRCKARRVLVVDDVRTTGATLAEVTRVLEAAGAAEVFTVALAGAVADDDWSALG